MPFHKRHHLCRQKVAPGGSKELGRKTRRLPDDVASRGEQVKRDGREEMVTGIGKGGGDGREDEHGDEPEGRDGGKNGSGNESGNGRENGDENKYESGGERKPGYIRSGNI